jgi:hypothetical protein
VKQKQLKKLSFQPVRAKYNAWVFVFQTSLERNNHMKHLFLQNEYSSFSFFSLAPQPSSGLRLLHKIRLNFLEAPQQFSFLQGRVVSPTLNPHPGGPGLCIYIPQSQGGYLF